MMQTSASERSSVRQAQKTAKIAESLRHATLTQLMSTPTGRAWMYDLLARCHIGSTPFSTDALTTAFQCGEQNIGLQLWGDLQSTCPDQYILMMREYYERSTIGQRSGGEDRDGDVDGPDPDPDDNDGDEARLN